MMVIVRFEPGALAPCDGRFALVGHFGEPTGFVCECKAGEDLPSKPVDNQLGGLLWYVEQPRKSAVRLAA
jgi:hypothetical protein